MNVLKPNLNSTLNCTAEHLQNVFFRFGFCSLIASKSTYFLKQVKFIDFEPFF